MSQAEFQLCEGLDYEISVFIKLELYTFETLLKQDFV